MEKHARRISSLFTFLAYTSLLLFPALREKLAEALAEMAFAGKIPRGLFPLLGRIELVDEKGTSLFLDTRPAPLFARLVSEDLVSSFFSRCINLPSHQELSALLQYNSTRFWMKKEEVSMRKEGAKFVILVTYTYQVMDSKLSSALTPINNHQEEATWVMEEPMPKCIIEAPSDEYCATITDAVQPKPKRSFGFIRYTGHDAWQQANKLNLPYGIVCITKVDDELTEVGIKSQDHKHIIKVIDALPAKQGYKWGVSFENGHTILNRVKAEFEYVSFKIEGQMWNSNKGLPCIPKGLEWETVFNGGDVHYLLTGKRSLKPVVVSLAEKMGCTPRNDCMIIPKELLMLSKK